MADVKKKLIPLVLLVVIVFIGGFFRYIDNRWDGGNYLHPDERFLTMVGAEMRVPETFKEYVDPKVSKLNPANLNFPFFVYGTFPLILNKFLAINLNADSYSYYGLLGRTVSASFDLLTIILIFKIVELWERHRKWPSRVKYLAAFFYAVAVMPIQLSHFFAVDTFLTTFMMASLLFALKYLYEGNRGYIAASALALGLSVACKASGAFIAPVIVSIIYIGIVGRHKAMAAGGAADGEKPHTHKKERTLAHIKEFFNPRVIIEFGMLMGIFALVGYIAVRLGDPYYFQTGNLFDLTLNEGWLKSVHELKSFEGIDVWFPPAIQWMTKPAVTFAFQNIAVFGVGVPFFVLSCIGIYYAFRKYLSLETGILFIWMLAFAFHQSLQFVKVMRYFIIIYPLLAILGGLATERIVAAIVEHTPKAQRQSRNLAMTAFILVAVLIWPLMFLNIYLRPHSRVTASQWMYDNLPVGFVLSEHWDDPIPLQLPDNKGKYFPGEQLEVFGEDGPEKFNKMARQMETADYYILSSNRAWGSMPTVPQKYPLMGKFYDDLFAGKKGYTTVKVFTSYPSLEWMGIPLTLADDWADESFTVYDHPKVIIMQNTRKAR